MPKVSSSSNPEKSPTAAAIIIIQNRALGGTCLAQSVKHETSDCPDQAFCGTEFTFKKIQKTKKLKNKGPRI